MKKLKLLLSILLVLMMTLSLFACASGGATIPDASSVSDDTPLEDEDGLTIFEEQPPLGDFTEPSESAVPQLSDVFPAEYFSASESAEFEVNTGGALKSITGTVKYSEIEKIFERVNKERGDKGLQPLQYDMSLQDGALLRAAEIVVSFSHTRPDGTKWKTAAEKCNGENIASGHKDATAVMNGWMKSEGHSANILKDDFTRIGIGAFESGGRMYWVQLFGF